MSKKVFFINSTLANYTDEEFSWFQKYALNAGVIGDSAGTLGLDVSANSPAGMSVLVGVGSAIIELTKSGVTWKTILVSSAIDTIVIAPNTSGANRVDAIIARIDKDAEPDALKSNIGTIEVVLGSGATALTDGAIATAIGNDGFIRLADITVANGASSIVAGDIADTRSQVVYNSALLPNPKKIQFSIVASDPTTLVEGMVWFNSTSHTLNFYDGSTIKTLGVSASGFNPLYAQAQGTPDMTLQVSAGVVKFLSAVCKYAGGNSPTFTAPAIVNQKRIDLLCIDSAGTLSVVQGTATTGTPSAPTYPTNKFVICEVYLRNASTSIKSSDDGTNGYISKDVRYFCSAENPTQKILTAGETISGATLPVPILQVKTALDFNFVDKTQGTSESGTVGLNSTAYRASQSFYSGDNNRLTHFSVDIIDNGSSYTLYWEIYAVDANKKPTGSAIGSGNQSIDAVSSNRRMRLIDFSSSPVTVSKNTLYAIVWWTNALCTGYLSSTGNSGNYYGYYSTNSGSTWTDQGAQFLFRVWGYDNESLTAGRVCASKANKINRADFLGFAVSTSSDGSDIVVQADGIVGGFTGLTVGATYYVQDSGGIGTTVGTMKIIVGKAISATEIAIEKDKRIYLGYEYNYFYTSATGSVYQEFPVPSCVKRIEAVCSHNLTQALQGILLQLDEYRTSPTISDFGNSTQHELGISRFGNKITMYSTGNTNGNKAYIYKFRE